MEAPYFYGAFLFYGISMNYILADHHSEDFYPLTLTRPIAELRCGMLTIREKWLKLLKADNISWFSEKHLSGKFALKLQSDNVLIDSRILPTTDLVKQIKGLLHNQALVFGETCVAIRVDASLLTEAVYPAEPGTFIDSNTRVIEVSSEPFRLDKLTQLFTANGSFIESDYKLLTKGKKSEKLNSTNTVIGDQLFVKGDVKANCSIFNTETGPIFIDKGAEVMEGCMLRGPLYIGKGAVVKMGAKIYGPTTIGPECRVGGEVGNSVLQGYSNKGHDGFLGNSILGEWCNLGADTNTSNLKNNYSEVKIWNYSKKELSGSGLQFCGLLMGDHSKAAINTQFNTGTTVGVMANVFSAGFPEKYIPSFSWMGEGTNDKYRIDRALSLAEDVMHRRHVEITEADKNILKYISEKGL